MMGPGSGGGSGPGSGGGSGPGAMMGPGAGGGSGPGAMMGATASNAPAGPAASGGPGSMMGVASTASSGSFPPPPGGSSNRPVEQAGGSAPRPIAAAAGDAGAPRGVPAQETEYDRLVREHLEGRHEHRAHTKRGFDDRSAYHNTWLGRLEGGTREGAWGLLSLLTAFHCGAPPGCHSCTQGRGRDLDDCADVNEMPPQLRGMAYEDETLDLSAIPRAATLGTAVKAG